jgi:hypothetical protein
MKKVERAVSVKKLSLKILVKVLFSGRLAETVLLFIKPFSFANPLLESICRKS